MRSFAIFSHRALISFDAKTHGLSATLIRALLLFLAIHVRNAHEFSYSIAFNHLMNVFKMCIDL